MPRCAHAPGQHHATLHRCRHAAAAALPSPPAAHSARPTCVRGAWGQACTATRARVRAPVVASYRGRRTGRCTHARARKRTRPFVLCAPMCLTTTTTYQTCSTFTVRPAAMQHATRALRQHAAPHVMPCGACLFTRPDADAEEVCVTSPLFPRAPSPPPPVGTGTASSDHHQVTTARAAPIYTSASRRAATAGTCSLLPHACPVGVCRRRPRAIARLVVGVSVTSCSGRREEAVRGRGEEEGLLLLTHYSLLNGWQQRPATRVCTRARTHTHAPVPSPVAQLLCVAWGGAARVAGHFLSEVTYRRYQRAGQL